MEPGLEPLHAMIRLNTDLLLNCLDGVSEEDARHRERGVNSLSYIALHLIDTRHFLAADSCGNPLENPVTEALGENIKIEDISRYPGLDDLRKWWTAAGDHLGHCFEEMDSARLLSPKTQPFPIEHDSVLGGMAFLIHHEAYHIGQAGILRRQLGYDAMSYERRGQPRFSHHKLT